MSRKVRYVRAIGKYARCNRVVSVDGEITTRALSLRMESKLASLKRNAKIFLVFLILLFSKLFQIYFRSSTFHLQKKRLPSHLNAKEWIQIFSLAEK